MGIKDTLIVVSPRLPLPRFLSEKEIMQFGILVVLEAQEIDFRGTLKANMMNIVYFYVNLFRFTKNFPLLSLCRLTEICLPQSPKPHVLN